MRFLSELRSNIFTLTIDPLLHRRGLKLGKVKWEGGRDTIKVNCGGPRYKRLKNADLHLIQD